MAFPLIAIRFVCVGQIQTRSGVTGKESPATSDWFQIVQTNSVCYYHVGCMNGRQVLIDIVCRTDEHFTYKLLPIVCP